MPQKKSRARQTVTDKTSKRSKIICSGETHDEPQDKPEDTEPPEPVSKKESVVSPAKKTKTYTHLTTEQQEAVVDWLKAHEVLYNKKLEGYKDTKKKAFLWQKQADEMGISVDELKIWYNSLRTRYTKLRKMKSGDGAPEHSERDQWVLNNFSFLAPFTYEVKKRTLVSFKAKLLQTTATTTTSDQIDDEDVTLSSGQMTSQGSENQHDMSLNTTEASPKASTSSAHKPSNPLTSVISGKMDEFMEMQNRLMQQMVRPNTDRMKEVFVDYIKETAYEIHPSLWEDMHRDIMKTVLMYKDRDNDLKRGQQHTATLDSGRSSVGWRPPSHMWSSTVQNPVSSWGSSEYGWNQQFPNRQQFPQQQQSQQSQNFFQPQQQTSTMQQQRPQGKQGTPQLNTPQLFPLDSASDSGFPSGLTPLVTLPSPTQQDGQQRDTEREDPL